MATRWGICGSGKISNDFTLCLNSLPPSEHQIVAVGASTKDKAESFAKEHGIPQSCGSYKELAELDNVDVVYIGTLHISHVEMCLLYISHGKHVLCEKPMSLTEEGCQKVLAAAKEKGVFFLEGIWSRFFPVYQEIRDQISAGALGDVKTVQVAFTIPIADVPRIKQRELGGGSLMDIGLYTVQAANLVFKGKPLKVTSEVSKFESGVDKTGNITLTYDNGCFASLVFSAESQGGDNYFYIRGTKGTMKIPDFFWCPLEVIVPGGQVKKFPLPDVENSDKLIFPNSQGFCHEARAVREALQKGWKEHPLMTHQDSEDIMYILNTVLAQHDIRYDFP